MTEQQELTDPWAVLGVLIKESKHLAYDQGVGLDPIIAPNDARRVPVAIADRLHSAGFLSLMPNLDGKLGGLLCETASPLGEHAYWQTVRQVAVKDRDVRAEGAAVMAQFDADLKDQLLAAFLFRLGGKVKLDARTIERVAGEHVIKMRRTGPTTLEFKLEKKQ